jgi:uncharacterized protein with FMN-binding domain
MSSKTKIVVIQLKELIYTAIFVVLGILLILLLIFMFLPKNHKDDAEPSSSQYIPGVYSSSLTLGENPVEIEVTVDSDHINSIRTVNLNETVTTMFPLLEPSLNSLSEQILQTQSLENISFSDDNKYTSSLLLNAIKEALSKAEVSEPSS